MVHDLPRRQDGEEHAAEGDKIRPGQHTVELRCGNCLDAEVITHEFEAGPGEAYMNVRNAFDKSPVGSSSPPPDE